jgi:hypothetical protein
MLKDIPEPLTSTLVPAADAVAIDPADEARTHRELESLLLHGRREEALKLAVDKHMFALALLIGSVCGREQFQLAARCFADKSFSVSSPLHFSSMLFSSQAHSILRHGGLQLNKAQSGSSGASLSAVVVEWRRHLAAILANKSADWVELARTLGDRVIAETNVMSL